MTIDNIEKELMEELEKNIEISSEAKNKAYDNMTDLYNREENMDKNNNRILKKISSLALIALIGFGAIQTGFAQEVVNRVKKIIKLEHIVIEEIENDKNTDIKQTWDVPEELKGRLFDRNGNPVEKISEFSILFDSEGYRLDSFNINKLERLERDSNGEIILLRQEDVYYSVDSLDKAEDYLRFDLKLPTELPKGYKLDSISFVKDGDIEDIALNSQDYAVISYSNGEDEFVIGEFLSNQDSSYGSSSYIDIEEIEINGNKAAINERGDIDIEIDDVILSLITCGNLNKDESIKLVESIK